MKQTFILFSIVVSLYSSAFACQGAVGGKEGMCAPDFRLTDLSGKAVQLSSLRGKVVLVNFWATWCEPCRIEIPILEKLYHRLPKNAVLLAANIDDEGQSIIEKFYKQTMKRSVSPFTILIDPKGETSRKYGTFQFPETYIIDKTGRVRDRVEGMIPDWDSSIMVHYIEKLTQE